jgi:hypothetical protein
MLDEVFEWVSEHRFVVLVAAITVGALALMPLLEEPPTPERPAPTVVTKEKKAPLLAADEALGEPAPVDVATGGDCGDRKAPTPAPYPYGWGWTLRDYQTVAVANSYPNPPRVHDPWDDWSRGPRYPQSRPVDTGRDRPPVNSDNVSLSNPYGPPPQPYSYQPAQWGPVWPNWYNGNGYPYPPASGVVSGPGQPPMMPGRVSEPQGRVQNVPIH